MKKKVLYAFAIWFGLLVFGAITVGAGVWQLRSAAHTIRTDNLTEVDAQDFASDIAWSNVLLKFAKFNPGVQMLRVVPGITWAPKAVSAGSNVVSEVNSILANGGAKVLATALSGELTPEPGTIDVKAAVGVAEDAQRIGDRALRLRSAVVDLGGLHVPGVSDSRISDAVAKATDYLDLAESAISAMKKLPQLIGSETPTRYFVGITNEAELRGVQGIIGEYAIIEIDNGKISVGRTGSNTELVNPKLLPLELVGDYSQTYGETNTEWQNMNLSPFLDPAALQITNAWKLQTGESLDGVILLDTVALAKWAIPKVGTIESAQGRMLATWEALADYLSNGVYFDFPTDQIARKQFQSELAGQLIEAITGSSLEPQQLFRSLAKPMIDGRVVAWLNGERGVGFNHTLIARSGESFPEDVVIGFNNWTGNKMDFYLRATATDQVECVESDVWHSLELALESPNIDMEGYPDYLARRLDLSANDEQVVGSYLDVSLVMPAGSGDFEVAINESEATYELHQMANGRITVRLQTEINVGEKTSISVRFQSGGRCDAYKIRMSPLRFSENQ